MSEGQPSAAVVVTGAASGIGRAACELFAERGFGVVAVDLPSADMAWTGNRSGIETVRGDVAQEATAVAMVSTASECFGRLDAAILNAGVSGSAHFEADDAVERFQRSVDVNVKSVVLGIRHCAPAMRAAGGGAIVATASTSGLSGDPGNWAYNASKAAVVNLVRAAAIDYAPHGIRVNAVAPGPTITGMTERLTASDRASSAMAAKIPLGRWGLASEIAEAMYFLASPAASFITGVTVPVDGGLTAHAGHFDLGTNRGRS